MNPHKTLFSRNIESLNLLDAPPISSGQKVFIPEALMPHLLDFHHKELAKFLKPGPQIVEVIVHEDYGTRIGEAWIDRRAGITLCLPFESTRREQHRSEERRVGKECRSRW